VYGERVAIGPIGKEDLSESLGDGPVKKEIILGQRGDGRATYRMSGVQRDR
jgi:hypothetical protein